MDANSIYHFGGNEGVSALRTDNYKPKTDVGVKQKKTLCVNFFAGQGAGKSTIATTTQGMLKMHNVNSEYTAEHAKDLAWEGRLSLKLNQMHLFAEQHNRQFRLNGQVDCIITDSPLPLCSVYQQPFDSLFHAMVMREFKKYENINFYIKRVKPYNPAGRLGDLKRGEDIDEKTMIMLDNEQIPYVVVNGDWCGANTVLKNVLERLNIKQLYETCRI